MKRFFLNTTKYKLTKESLDLMSKNHKLFKDIFLAIEEGEENKWIDFIEKINAQLCYLLHLYRIYTICNYI